MQTERQETIANIGEDLFAIAVDQPFRLRGGGHRMGTEEGGAD